MCIIISNQSKKLDCNIMINATMNNPDGFGLAWAKDGQILIRKYAPTDAYSFIMDYFEIRDIIDTPILLHARIATHGEISKRNAHPYVIRKDLIVAHNGIIPGYGDEHLVDTVDYIDRVLSKMKNPLRCTRRIIRDIGDSKLAFMDNSGTITIINSNKGHMDTDGNWYSNYSYMNI